MSEPATISRTLPKPLMVFDGDCHFCTRWIKRWQKTTGQAVDYAPFQEASADLPEIPRARFEREVVLVVADGRVFGGAEAVFRSLNCGDRPGFIAKSALWMYQHAPGFAVFTEACYRFVAEHRTFFSAITRVTALVGIP